MTRSRQLAALALATAVLLGCSSDDDSNDANGIEEIDPTEDAAADDASEEPDDTSGEAESDASDEIDDGDSDDPTDDDVVDPEPDDPFALPDEIDPAYADAVINELFRIHVEVFEDARQGLETGQPLPADLLDPLRAISSEDQFARYASQLQDRVDTDFAISPDTIEPMTFETDIVLEDTDSCFVAFGTYDFTGITDFDRARATAEEAGTDGPDDDFTGRLFPYVFILVPSDDARDPGGVNQTGWMLRLEGGDRDGDPAWRPSTEIYAEDCA